MNNSQVSVFEKDDVKIYSDNWIEKTEGFQPEFTKVTTDILDKLKEKDFIKISNGTDLFWVKIVDINTLGVIDDSKLSGKIIGKVDNNLLPSTEYNSNDFISIDKNEKLIFDYIEKDQVDNIRVNSFRANFY